VRPPLFVAQLSIAVNILFNAINLHFSFVYFVKTFVNFVVEFYHEEHKEYTKGTKSKTPVIGEAEYTIAYKSAVPRFRVAKS
jgi:hypothetical protein